MSQFFQYESARRQLRANANLNPVDVAEQFGLSTGLAQLLIATTNLWDRNKDFSAFRDTTEVIYDNKSFDDTARAMAAEHRSSCDEGEERIAWGVKVAELVNTGNLDPDDAQLVSWSTYFGEVDKSGRKFTKDEVEEGLAFMVDFGAYNAPGRTLWWLQNGATSDEGVEWLGRVIDRADNEPHAMNEFYLGKAREKLAELTAS